MGKIKKDSLGDRQKAYEAVNDRILVPKMPFIIRVDGKAFHTYTRGFVKPFDEIMCKTMIEVTKKLCEEIPGAVLGYTQSDEITIVCKYTDRIKSQAWFNGRLRKIETIAASKATKWFNKIFSEKVTELRNEFWLKIRNGAYELYAEVFNAESQEKADKLAEKIANNAVKEKTNFDLYVRKAGLAEFDARAFNIPEWDCINNVIWRQQDATRNSIEAVGHANFSTKELHKVNCDGIKEMLLKQKNINWESDFTPYQKYGAFCYKIQETRTIKGETVERTLWYCNPYEEYIITEDRNRFRVLTDLSEN